MSRVPLVYEVLIVMSLVAGVAMCSLALWLSGQRAPGAGRRAGRDLPDAYPSRRLSAEASRSPARR
ncbi:hypothetical protein [Streptomyces sp. SAI-090]|jgi:hypothetical protein|uniref:hypothetical protein n=1 Tax=Streptomyces sp. SAI-090 TaxID=2940545 RepID=UPI0024740547|nr:hypothetical protein [Streptomyces sp. SAI-090]MDH6522300.1 hypothetical protein [Streptomyces sp. SAI-090]